MTEQDERLMQWATETIRQLREERTALRHKLESLRAELDDVLCDVSQVLDGWHQDGTAWSKWDEQVRQKVRELHERVVYQ